MAWVAPVIAIAGSLFQMQGQKQAGAAAQQSAEFTALQEDQAASNTRGAAQRSAEEERRQARLADSRATALAAASGGGATDVTTTNIRAGIAGEGEFRALNRLYQGEDQAIAYNNDALLNRMGGADAMRAANTAATGTLIQSGSSLMDRYGGNSSTSAATTYKPIAYRTMG